MSLVGSIVRHRLYRIWHFLVSKDILTFILFVFIATLIWWGRTMATVRDATLFIPIAYHALPEEVMFETPLPDHFKVKVRDEGRQIRRIHRNIPTMEINMGALLTERNGILHINSETLHARLKDLLPGSLLVLECTPESMDIPYTYQSQKNVPIKVTGEWNACEQYQLIGTPEVTPAQVRVYGTSSRLQSIQSIETHSIKAVQVKDSLCITAKLICPDHVRIVPEQVQVVLRSEQFTEKQFHLPIQVQNVPKDIKVVLIPHETTVSVRVGISHFKEVNQDDIQAVCSYPAEGQTSLPVRIESTNPLIRQTRVDPSIVEFYIEQ